MFRVLFVSPWTSLIPLLSFHLSAPPRLIALMPNYFCYLTSSSVSHTISTNKCNYISNEIASNAYLKLVRRIAT